MEMEDRKFHPIDEVLLVLFTTNRTNEVSACRESRLVGSNSSEMEWLSLTRKTKNQSTSNVRYNPYSARGIDVSAWNCASIALLFDYLVEKGEISIIRRWGIFKLPGIRKPTVKRNILYAHFYETNTKGNSCWYVSYVQSNCISSRKTPELPSHEPYDRIMDTLKDDFCGFAWIFGTPILGTNKHHLRTDYR